MAQRVALRCTPAALPLRALTGFDEQAVEDLSAESAVALLERLLDDPGRAATLPAADRDALLAAVHRAAFGDRIESTVTCPACGEPFDLAFALSELEDSLETDWPDDVQRGADGVLESPDLGRFLLPTGADELAVAGADADAAATALLQRCVIEAGPAFEREAFEDLLNRIAPLVDADLEATCPECGAHRTLRFDIQSYLLGTLLVERERLVADLHRLATAYGWGHGEILGMPRQERRALVGLVEAEAPR